jgi:tetratricopeptide (TPR) repeat protein
MLFYRKFLLNFRDLYAWLLLFGCSPALRAQQQPMVGAAGWMLRGSSAMHQGRPGEAEIAFRHAVEQEPGNAQAHLDLGLARLQLGKPNEAEHDLAQAIELQPNLLGANMFLGIAEFQQKKFDNALEALNREAALQPENIEVLSWTGIVALGAAKPDAAIGPLDKAAVLAPDDSNVLYYRGRAHSQVAAESYRELYRVDPGSALLHRALGESFSESGQPDRAIAEFKAAIKKQPNNADLYESLANEEQKISRFAEASATYEQELKLSPGNPIALYNIGKIEVESAKPEAGVAHLRQALAENADPGPTSFYLGLGLAKLDHLTDAVEYLEKSVAMRPSNFILESAYYQLGRIYQRLGRTADSEHAIETVKKMKAQDAKETSNMGPNPLNPMVTAPTEKQE